MSSTRPVSLNYLVFDDDPEAPEQYKTKILMQGYDPNLIFINPTEFFNADQNVFEENEFVKCIEDKIKGFNINLIISDWNILPKNESFAGFVGWDVLECILKVKERLKNRTFLLYSADLNKASQHILNKITAEVSANPGNTIPSLEFVKKILELRLKFCKRDDNRFGEIITLLKESNTISNIVLNSILNFDQNTIINTGNNDFDGKKISDILHGPNSDNGGLKFIREFIELSVANYSELNAN